MTKKRKIFIAIYLILLIILLVIIYTVPSVSRVLTKTEILQYGTLRVVDDAECFIIRDEIVYLAGDAGTINYYVSQGTHLRSDAKVLSIIPSGYSVEKSKYAGIITELGAAAVQTSTYTASTNGIVSYYADGYEAYFSPDSMLDIEFSDIKDTHIQVTNLTREETMRGEPIYKICDNNEWYLTAWVGAGDITKYEIGNSVTIELPKADLKATVYDIQKEGEFWQVIFATNRYYEDFATLRKVDTKIVTSDYSGIIIPNKSIGVLEGVPGVYVKSKSGDYKFKPIEIITSDGTNSLAEVSYFYDKDGKRVGTVEVYDEILKEPKQ